MAATVFDLAGATLHRDPNLGLDATYTPSGGVACTVRVVPSYAPEVEGLLSTGTRRATLRVDVLVQDVPTRPSDGDTVRLGSTAFRVRSATKDDAGVFWTLDLDPA